MTQQSAVLEVLLDRLAGNAGVDLAAVYGSYGTADETAVSDVDIFYVPADDGPHSPASLQVIVADIGYDLWPVGWERLTRIADLEDTLTPLLTDARVVFGDQSAVARFEQLQERCHDRLADVEHRLDAARELLNRAAAHFTIAPPDDRLATAEAVSTLLTAIAFRSGNHLHTSPGRILDRGAEWLPEDLQALLHTALTAQTPTDRSWAFRSAAHRTSQLIDDFAATEPTPAADRPNQITGFYEELHSVLNKIPRAVAAGDECTTILATASAVIEMGTHLHFLQTGRWPKDRDQITAACRAADLPDLLGGLDDPKVLVDRTQTVMAALPRYLQQHGVSIRQVSNADALRQSLL